LHEQAGTLAGFGHAALLGEVERELMIRMLRQASGAAGRTA
jgi:hypothetical protein